MLRRGSRWRGGACLPRSLTLPRGTGPPSPGDAVHPLHRVLPATAYSQNHLFIPAKEKHDLGLQKVK